MVRNIENHYNILVYVAAGGVLLAVLETLGLTPLLKAICYPTSNLQVWSLQEIWIMVKFIES